MTQLHNLDPHDAQEIVDQNNPKPDNTDILEEVSYGYYFLEGAINAAHRAGQNVAYAFINVEYFRVSFGIEGGPSWIEDITKFDADYCENLLAEVKCSLATVAATRAQRIRMQIDDLTRELNKVEGRA